jgi:hypothetical protein
MTPRVTASSAASVLDDCVFLDWYSCTLDLDLSYRCTYRPGSFCMLVSDGEPSVW